MAWKQVQTREHLLTYRAGTPEGDHFAQDMAHSFHTVRPFLHKWTKVPTDYDDLYQQALQEMQQPDFEATRVRQNSFLPSAYRKERNPQGVPLLDL